MTNFAIPQKETPDIAAALNRINKLYKLDNIDYCRLL